MASHQATLSYAQQLDKNCPLASVKDLFCLPTHATGAYLCGQSLGAMPKAATQDIQSMVNQWQSRGTSGYFESQTPWLTLHEQLIPMLAKLVGAKDVEVNIMNSLTVNLHLMMASFFQPTKDKHKVLIEEQAFCSDQYAISSQLKFHGFDEQDVILVKPKKGESHLNTQDILAIIQKHKDELALIVLPSVQYFTGQVLDIKTIAQQAQTLEVPFGVDCAHAVGNIPLELHEWGVDFAVWCHYKYMNSGPGAPGGIFVHQKHHGKALNRLAGWWGHDKASRFEMGPDFKPIKGALGWQLSCPPILSMMPLKASLEIFDSIGFEKLREKSCQLTGYLRYLLQDKVPSVQIITPETQTPGAQLSIRLKGAQQVCEALVNKGFHCDYRNPNVIRIAPMPLYNTYEEVFHFVQTLKGLIGGKDVTDQTSHRTRQAN